MAYKPGMGETHFSGLPNSLDSSDASAARRPVLLRLGGMLGFAAACIGLLLFLLGCAGVSGAFRGFSLVPVIFGGLGLFFSILGGVVEKDRITESTHVLAAVFTGLIGLIGGLCEMAVWLNWQTFAK